ncbi:MAG TPA: 30S ribosomal protein S21 [Anaerolineae bacterium]
MAGVVVVRYPDESLDDLLRRFQRHVQKTGMAREAHRKQWFVSKSEQHRRELRKAIRQTRLQQNNEPKW